MTNLTIFDKIGYIYFHVTLSYISLKLFAVLGKISKLNYEIRSDEAYCKFLQASKVLTNFLLLPGLRREGRAVCSKFQFQRLKFDSQRKFSFVITNLPGTSKKVNADIVNIC